MKVALVHDYLNQFGGAERVLKELAIIFPRAPIFTLIYDQKSTGRIFADRKIITSFLQKIPFARSRHRFFPLLMPLAVEEFDLSGFDMVISDSAGFAKGIITKPGVMHICYCHTPLRFVWDDSHRYLEEFNFPRFIKKITPLFLSYLRLWDSEASRRVDYFLANSYFVAKRIKKYYQRESTVIYPPVDFDFFSQGINADGEKRKSGKSDGYFLLVGRLVAYKKFDIVISAFNKRGFYLKVIGIGPEFKRLKKIAGDNKKIEFLGLVSDEKLRDLYQGSLVLIFPQEEDFGITALEAMSAGRPVIAYKGGGALEIIKENISGLFFEQQNQQSLLRALDKFEPDKFNFKIIQAEAEKFHSHVFREKILDFLTKTVLVRN